MASFRNSAARNAALPSGIVRNAALPSGIVDRANWDKCANQEIGGPEEIGGPAEIGGPGEIRGPGGEGWFSRGYLPHYDEHGRYQHVTFHLADSLPKSAIEQIEASLRHLPEDKRKIERRQRVDKWLDAGRGSCILGVAGVAQMVCDALSFFDGERYALAAWVVMPNHAHVLFATQGGWELRKIVASWKKFTARRICEYLKQADREIGGPGNANLPIGARTTPRPVWHREYWDRYMRDEGHFLRTVDYIHQNPVKAGLVEKPEKWFFSSARDWANIRSVDSEARA